MYNDYLILGGAGLVGLQVCRHIVHHMEPRRIIVASLLQAEAEGACEKLENEYGSSVAFVPTWGNLFVPHDLANKSRGELRSNSKIRRRLLASLYDDFDKSYRENHLSRMLKQHRPDVVVDCVNTATGLSYQDVFDGATKVREWITDDGVDSSGVEDLEALLLSQSAPQIIRHVRILHRATTEYSTKVYVKVGTTGTGGMGLNIPYTHSEDKPSKVLLAKTEAAFGHTGLLFLLARTPDAPIVKEVKPAAMIGYRGVEVRPARDKHGNDDLFAPKALDVGQGDLELVDDPKLYTKQGKLKVPIVDTGENGVFTAGEFAAITALGQMEYITPEEIARVVVREIRGANTGQDVISAMDASVLNPSYKAGLLRSAAMHDLSEAEQDSGVASIALGRLGPPELSKLLFEAHLFKSAFGDFDLILDPALKPDKMSKALEAALEPSGVSTMAPSIGIPVMLSSGKKILRGPRINVPEVKGRSTVISMDKKSAVDRWAKKGWIDLRTANMKKWKDRFSLMVEARRDLRQSGSAASNIQTYMGPSLEIGEVVAWIFNNEMGGHRIK
ncbi:MAG: hypothetical protein ACPGTU_00685 [Myxococcota bacterium]